jgi:alkanesulfonate monooxygenase SsuD/methylene tetrahydromethanopterin reductase-like flavin-dependent oxidoreductase (luciferase family)
MVHGIRHGSFEPMRSPEAAAAHPAMPAAMAMRTSRVAGTPGQVTAQLDALVEATGADELMVSTVTHGLDARLRSLELLTEAWST